MADRSLVLPDFRNLPAPVHENRLRIYYEDTDAGGIVYYANYLRFFERARSDWLRQLGAVHRELDAAQGLVFVVKEAAIEYLSPARLDDEIIVDVRILEARRASLRLAQCARHLENDSLLVISSVRVAAIDRASGRPVAFPVWLADRLAHSATS
jgi:acyl-CoA thioester hydrolase